VFEDDFCGEGYIAITQPSVTNLTGLTGGVSFAVLLFGVLGVQVIGQEYRFNTIRPTFTAAPNRFKVLAAKLIVVSLACAAVSVVMIGFCYLVGTTMLDRFEVDGVDQRIMWSIPLFAALWTMAGVGVGAIVRQPIAGILILLGESLVLESLLSGILEWTTPWLPFSNGFQMTLRLDDGDSILRPVLEGGIYFAVVCAGLWVLGAVLANRRDA
jgi:ABC-2 type transport system permease protein